MAETTPSAALGLYLIWLDRHGLAYQNVTGEVHVSLPERVPYMLRDDTIMHPSKQGERLIDIAAFYYRDQFADLALDCAEIIAQFQDPPIVDMSDELPQGLVLQIPSADYIQEVALGESLSEYPTLD